MCQEKGSPGFDPLVDDTELTEGWLRVPIAQVPAGVHPSGYRVERQVIHYADVFGRSMKLAAPLECRFLYDPAGRLWMSDTPQERIMMYNNGRRTHGSVLVGGLGLGLYLQYAAAAAAGRAVRFTVIEHSSVVRDIIEPTVSAALDVPLDVRIGDVAAYLAQPATERFDRIFLDTWATLDAAHLPAINRLRNLALDHLAPGGRVLLWGYRWMVRLFEDACRQLLDVAPGKRQAWLTTMGAESPNAVALLTPVANRFRRSVVNDVEEALTWCRQYIVQNVAPL